MYLANQQGLFAFRNESACVPGKPRATAQGSNYRRLFDDQWHDAFLAIDDKIRSDRERQPENAAHILDHLVRSSGRQNLSAGKQLVRLRRRQPSTALKFGNPISNTEFVESRHARIAHRSFFPGSSFLAPLLSISHLSNENAAAFSPLTNASSFAASVPSNMPTSPPPAPHGL